MVENAQSSLDYLLVFGGAIIVFLIATITYFSITEQQFNISNLGFNERQKSMIDEVYIEKPRHDNKSQENTLNVEVELFTKKKLKNVTYIIRDSTGKDVFTYSVPRDYMDVHYSANSWEITTLQMPNEEVLKSGELYDLVVKVQYENDVIDHFIQKKSIIGS